MANNMGPENIDDILDEIKNKKSRRMTPEPHDAGGSEAFPAARREAILDGDAPVLPPELFGRRGAQTFEGAEARKYTLETRFDDIDDVVREYVRKAPAEPRGASPNPLSFEKPAQSDTNRAAAPPFVTPTPDAKPRGEFPNPLSFEKPAQPDAEQDAPPSAPDAEPRGEFPNPLSFEKPAQSGSERDAPPSAPDAEPRGEFPNPLSFEKPAQSGSERDAPPPPPVADTELSREERPNPLSFEGHVQSITDRARMRQRPGKFGARPAVQIPEPVPRQDDTAVIDFSAFQAGVWEAAGVEPADDLNETRVLRMEEIDALRSRPSRLGGLDLDGDGDEDEPYIEEDDDEYDEDDFADDGGIPRPAVDFSEYNSVEDRRDVAIDIARVKLWLVIRLAVTLLLTGALFWVTLAANNLGMPLPTAIQPETEAGLGAYLMTLTVGSVLVALAGSSTMGGGLLGLFKMRANSDTLAALAMLGGIGQSVFATMRPELVRLEALTLYCCVAAAGMLFNALGKMTMISRIQANFKIIASDRPRHAVLPADDEAFCRHFVKGTPRRPVVAVAARADFFTDFLALSYSDKFDVGIHKVVAPICLVSAVIVGILTYMLTEGDTMAAVSALTAILCVASTFTATFIENIPLGKLTKKLTPRGGMVSGNKAVEDFCDAAAVVLTETDLFPPGHVKVSLSPFEVGRLDEAIVDAASVICAAGSAMSGAFLEKIGGNRKLLRGVENLVCETGRGLSAWVDSRRVLIGNEKLMQAHGVALPAQSFDAKYQETGGELFYLAVGGEACARLVAAYKIDEALAVELDRLAAKDKLLIVYAVDANLTAEKIWSLYSYPEKLIRIVPAEQHERLKAQTAPRGQAPALIATTGKAPAMVGAVLACITARSSILAGTMAQLIQIALGYGLVALLAFLGSMSSLSVSLLAAYQTFWFVVIWLLQKMRTA